MACADIRSPVVIPLYNKRPYIRRASDGVFSQTFTDFESIVVDDGSRNESHEMLADIADPRLRLIRQANAGGGAARNRDVEMARESWMAFLDADGMRLRHALRCGDVGKARAAAGFGIGPDSMRA